MPSTLGRRSRGPRIGFSPKRCARLFIMSLSGSWEGMRVPRRSLRNSRLGSRRERWMNWPAFKKGLTAKTTENQRALHGIRIHWHQNNCVPIVEGGKVGRKPPWDLHSGSSNPQSLRWSMIRDEVGCLRWTFHWCRRCAIMRRTGDASGSL